LSQEANYTDLLSDRRLLAKLVPTLADRGCRVVSATIPPQSLIFGFLDQSCYFLEIAPQLHILNLSLYCIEYKIFLLLAKKNEAKSLIMYVNHEI
jgi:hypothetical protein